MLNRRRMFLLQVAALLTVGSARAAGPAVKVYKSATCGCCGLWIEHMQAAGFEVEATNVADVNVYKQEFGLPVELASCHTALVEGYVIEGHVPADDVIRLLKERPDVAGIAVPGMPIGSPGMEGPNPGPYQSFAFRKDGSTVVFSEHRP